MAITHTIIAAAHAKGTHHYLVLDALDRLKTPHASAWKNVFYAHIEKLLEGAKAPDNDFKDFKNHVLHPRDNYWGGAPVSASNWYAKCVTALGAQDWAAAAYAAGVLSHYMTDPVQPFHTAQSEAENCIHRACEWSINRSYPALRAIGVAKFAATVVPVSTEANWLARIVCHGADRANAKYEKLIACYDIHRGVVDPPSGLDATGQTLVAEMIMLAVESCAVAFDKAFADANVAPPAVSLVTKSLGAIATLPRTWMLKRMANADDRRIVERMYDELNKTGTVEINLPADDRVVRDLHKAEVIDAQTKPDLGKIFPFNPSPEAVARIEQSRIAEVRAKGRPPEGKVIAMEPVRAAPARRDAPPIRHRADVARQIADEVKAGGADEEQVQIVPLPIAVKAPAAATAPVVSAGEAVIETVAAPVAAFVSRPDVETLTVSAIEPPSIDEPTPLRPTRPASLDDALAQGLSGALAAAIATITPFSMVSGERMAVKPEVAEPSADAKPYTPRTPQVARDVKAYLTGEQDVVDAPSIGPKTADRLRVVGIDTVDEFLKSHPIALAARLDVKHITAEVLGEWQDQARLVMAVPGLRGTHAQFLVGAGFRTLDAVAFAKPEALCAAVLSYVASAEGKRLLRDGTPPDIERIKSWLEHARAAKAA
jgi:hypothetical protein